MVELLVVLVVVGVLLWLVNQYVPMQPPFKTVVNVVVVLALIVWVLQFFGLFDAGSFSHYHRHY